MKTGKVMFPPSPKYHGDGEFDTFKKLSRC